VIVVADLQDKVLAERAAKYLPEANAWLVQKASNLGVLQSEILPSLPYNAKRAGVLKLACLTALGECGTNQGAFNGQVQDVYLVKYNAYTKELDAITDDLSRVDFVGPENAFAGVDQEGSKTPRLGRG
jgi:hypothetical protein